MLPITQDIFINDPQGRPGNCLQAAVASLLELRLDQVPHFISQFPDTWFEELANFLLENGFEWEDQNTVFDSEEYLLVFGPSPRGAAHAVIYKDGELAHDPHPSRAGILEVRWCASVYKAQAALYA